MQARTIAIFFSAKEAPKDIKYMKNGKILKRSDSVIFLILGSGRTYQN